VFYVYAKRLLNNILKDRKQIREFIVHSLNKGQMTKNLVHHILLLIIYRYSMSESYIHLRL